MAVDYVKASNPNGAFNYQVDSIPSDLIPKRQPKAHLEKPGAFYSPTIMDPRVIDQDQKSPAGVNTNFSIFKADSPIA